MRLNCQPKLKDENNPLIMQVIILEGSVLPMW